MQSIHMMQYFWDYVIIGCAFLLVAGLFAFAIFVLGYTLHDLYVSNLACIVKTHRKICPCCVKNIHRATVKPIIIQNDSTNAVGNTKIIPSKLEKNTYVVGDDSIDVDSISLHV